MFDMIQIVKNKFWNWADKMPNEDPNSLEAAPPVHPAHSPHQNGVCGCLRSTGVCDREAFLFLCEMQEVIHTLPERTDVQLPTGLSRKNDQLCRILSHDGQGDVQGCRTRLGASSSPKAELGEAILQSTVWQRHLGHHRGGHWRERTSCEVPHMTVMMWSFAFWRAQALSVLPTREPSHSVDRGWKENTKLVVPWLAIALPRGFFLVVADMFSTNSNYYISNYPPTTDPNRSRWNLWR